LLDQISDYKLLKDSALMLIREVVSEYCERILIINTTIDTDDSAEWLASLLRIREVQSSNLVADIDYGD
jgi:hypothetical protein